MRVRSTMIAVALCGIALGSSAAGGHQTQGTDTTGRTCGSPANMVVLVEGEETLYVDVREVGSTSLGSIRVYMESNGHAGLQTRKGTPNDLTMDPADSETCTTAAHANRDPDTLIF